MRSRRQWQNMKTFSLHLRKLANLRLGGNCLVMLACPFALEPLILKHPLAGLLVHDAPCRGGGFKARVSWRNGFYPTATRYRTDGHRKGIRKTACTTATTAPGRQHGRMDDEWQGVPPTTVSEYLYARAT